MIRPFRRDTALLHTPTAADPALRTVGPVIQKGSTVLLPDAASLYDDDRITYGRAGLAAHHALIDGLKVLEGAVHVSVYPSGVSALSGALAALLKAGDDILVTDAVYKPTRRFCDRVLARFGVSTQYYRPRASAEEILAMARPNTRLIVLESPGSLSMELQDAPAIAAAARKVGLLTLIDNTWAAGLYFRPLDHGLDVSVQSLTKYVGGHSDTFMGSVAAKDPAIIERLEHGALDFGWAVSPEDAYAMLRGLRTLPTRLARHDASARRVAAWLATQASVADVAHPALPGSPDHAVWRRDFTGAAGLFAFTLSDACPRAVEGVLDALRLFGLGFSWGGFESLALHCGPQLAIRRHASNPPPPTIRLSIGLEDPDDLIGDLDQALGAG